MHSNWRSDYDGIPADHPIHRMFAGPKITPEVAAARARQRITEATAELATWNAREVSPFRLPHDVASDARITASYVRNLDKARAGLGRVLHTDRCAA